MSSDAEEVVAKLIDAARASGGWCRFEQVLEDGGRRPVFVNSGAVRLVTEAGEPGASPRDAHAEV